MIGRRLEIVESVIAASKAALGLRRLPVYWASVLFIIQIFWLSYENVIPKPNTASKESVRLIILNALTTQCVKEFLFS